MKEQTSSYKDTEDIVSEIQREDKALRGKYIIVMILCLIGGGIFGAFLIKGFENEILWKNVGETVQQVLMRTTPYLVFIMAVVSICISAILYNQARKIYKVWDGEEEDSINRIEKKLSLVLMINSIETVLFFLFTAIWLVAAVYAVQTDAMLQFMTGIEFYFIGFGIMMISQTIGQRKTINFEKEINPEKKGSVYDMRFHKKWLDSCDEAQQLIIYKAGYSSYQAINRLCMILMFCNMAGIMMWNWGMVPAFMVAIIWLVSVISYYRKVEQLSDKK